MVISFRYYALRKFYNPFKFLKLELHDCNLLSEKIWLYDNAPVICIPGSLGAGDSGDIAGLSAGI